MEGLKWRVRDGSQIGVWEDTRLRGNSSTLIHTPNIESPATLRVADLIDAHGRWCEEALSTHLTEDDVALAREIPLSERRPVDVMYR